MVPYYDKTVLRVHASLLSTLRAKLSSLCISVFWDK